MMNRAPLAAFGGSWDGNTYPERAASNLAETERQESMTRRLASAPSEGDEVVVTAFYSPLDVTARFNYDGVYRLRRIDKHDHNLTFSIQLIDSDELDTWVYDVAPLAADPADVESALASISDSIQRVKERQ